MEHELINVDVLAQPARAKTAHETSFKTVIRLAIVAVGTIHAGLQWLDDDAFADMPLGGDAFADFRYRARELVTQCDG